MRHWATERIVPSDILGPSFRNLPDAAICADAVFSSVAAVVTETIVGMVGILPIQLGNPRQMGRPTVCKK